MLNLLFEWSIPMLYIRLFGECNCYQFSLFIGKMIDYFAFACNLKRYSTPFFDSIALRLRSKQLRNTTTKNQQQTLETWVVIWPRVRQRKPGVSLLPQIQGAVKFTGQCISDKLQYGLECIRYNHYTLMHIMYILGHFYINNTIWY